MCVYAYVYARVCVSVLRVHASLCVWCVLCVCWYDVVCVVCVGMCVCVDVCVMTCVVFVRVVRCVFCVCVVMWVVWACVCFVLCVRERMLVCVRAEYIGLREGGCSSGYNNSSSDRVATDKQEVPHAHRVLCTPSSDHRLISGWNDVHTSDRQRSYRPYSKQSSQLHVGISCGTKLGKPARV